MDCHDRMFYGEIDSDAKGILSLLNLLLRINLIHVNVNSAHCHIIAVDSR